MDEGWILRLGSFQLKVRPDVSMDRYLVRSK